MRLFLSALILAGLPGMGLAQDAPIAETTPEALVEALTPPVRFRGISVTEVAAPSIDLAVEFAYDSATLSEGAKALLADLGTALTDPRLAEYTFKIAGHTDAVGSAAYNETLSEARAEAVKAFLAGQFGVDPARLDAMGLGETNLLFPDAPEDGRNRRVEVSTVK